MALPDAPAVVKVSPSAVVTTLTNTSSAPIWVAVDADDNVYVGDGFGQVWKVTPAGSVSLFASGFEQIQDLAFDSAGDGTVTTFAGGFSEGIRSLAYHAAALYVADAAGTVWTVPTS